VSLKYMLDFGANPIERQLILSAQFLHNELPVRAALGWQLGRARRHTLLHS